MLRDIDGNEHALPEASGAKATVVYSVTHDCPISNRYAPEIRRICDNYSPHGARRPMACVDPMTTAEQVREHRQAYGSAQPAVHDEDRELGELVELAGTTITPESTVFDGAGCLVYRGRAAAVEYRASRVASIRAPDSQGHRTPTKSSA